MKLNHTFLLILCAAWLCWNCTGKESTNEETSTEEIPAIEEPSDPTLTVAWQTDTVLTTNESVLYDKNSHQLYVSNIQGDPAEKDGKGSISILDTDGTIKNLDWVTGLNGPKGMAIMNGTLYVTDIDRLVAIDMEKGEIANKYPVDGAEFLNDAATDGQTVYFSDSNTGTIYTLKNDKVSVYKENAKGVNGLAVNDKGNLYKLDESGLVMIDGDSSMMINDVVTGGDGLVIIDSTTYLASRWNGEIYLIRDGKEFKLLDTTDSLSTADIGYIPEQKLVLVPTFFGNKVAAYKLDY